MCKCTNPARLRQGFVFGVCPAEEQEVPSPSQRSEPYVVLELMELVGAPLVPISYPGAPDGDTSGVHAAIHILSKLLD